MEHTMSSGQRAQLPAELINTGWKPNKWVMYDGRIGIVVKFTPTVEVHLVDEKGETYLVVHTNLQSIRIAKWLEIPAVRRPTKEAGEALGYGA